MFMSKLLKMRDAIISWGIDSIFDAIVAIRAYTNNTRSFPYSLAELRLFPKGSLGHCVTALLDSQGYEFIPNYETHDIRHVLYEYPMTLEGEVQMMAFQAGCKNGWKNLFVWIALSISLISMPDRWKSLFKHYKRGANLPNIEINPNFETLLALPLHEVRARIGLEFSLF
jgi:hypothetical protein